MPKRFEHPVTLPPAVFEELEAIQGLHRTHMLDHQAVQDLAARLGFSETAAWIEEHQHEYSEGLHRGFVSAR